MIRHDSGEHREASDDASDERWTPIEQLQSGGAGRSFVSGEPNGDRLRVRYFQRARDRALVAKVWFGPGAEGPPGHAHGGSMAAVLDEAMGAAAWMAGHQVLAAKLTVEFRRMLQLETEVQLEARVDRVEGRKVTTRGRLFGPTGDTYAEAEGLFIAVTADRLDRLGDLPARACETFRSSARATSEPDE